MDKFNLEKAIADWRRQMQSAGLKNSDALNELESHLREEIQQQMQAGLAAQQAFEAAATHIGGAQALNTEFAKLRRTHMDFLARLKRFLLRGFLPNPALPPLSAFTPNAQQTLELARAEAPRLNHDFIGTEHVLLGLLNSPAGIIPDIMGPTICIIWFMRRLPILRVMVSIIGASCSSIGANCSIMGAN